MLRFRKEKYQLISTYDGAIQRCHNYCSITTHQCTYILQITNSECTYENVLYGIVDQNIINLHKVKVKLHSC